MRRLASCKTLGAVTGPEGCPDELELYELANGTLSSERASFVRDHIGDCDACRRVVAELSSVEAGGAATPGTEDDSARYALRRLIATGGMGEVFLARDNLLGRDVAIKLLHEDAASPGSLARSRRRILREAQALASFAHPNVVAAYDLGVLDGRAFLAMEYVAGRSLRQWIAEERPPRERIVAMLVQAGRGLAAAHERGLVHRDFKPDNVLVGQDGRARVTDFGLAALAESTPTGSVSEGRRRAVSPASSVTLDGEMSGTPAYMAPEQLGGAPATDRSDQYAFCVTMYEALHGGRPGATVTADPSDRLERALARGLSTDPQDRFPSLGLLLAELETPAAPDGHRGGRSASRLLAFAALASVVALGASVVGWWVLRARPASAPPVLTASLHALCGGASGASCPPPLVCRYPETSSCGASGAPGACAWPVDGCDATSGAVCGCDGVTYPTACDANRQGTSVSHGGACVTCTGGETCADTTTSGARVPSFCRITGSSGTCSPRPSACEAGGSPVCGWDGRTYGGPCDARRAGTDVRHEGLCDGEPPGDAAPRREPIVSSSAGLTYGAPDEQDLDARPLQRLASFVEAEKLPLYSLLVSKNGVVVFELYTSQLTRDHAHYLMGITASVTSALVGAAVDRHLIVAADASVADALPAALFPDASARERFRAVTVQDVLGLSALDAPVPPHDMSEVAQERLSDFLASPNRTAFALRQQVLPRPGISFQRTDLDGVIATGILEYRTKETALEFAEETLFRPMEFRNYEWMHQDAAGIDNGAWGLRLRPIDMQKLGLLFLSQGLWGGQRLLSSDWVLRSLSPWIKTSEELPAPNYGWGWTLADYGSVGSGQPWVAHVASGWKGQRIAVFTNQAVVVTMTGVVEPPEDEAALFRRIVRDYVMPAVDGTGAEHARPDASLRAPLASLLERIRTGPSPLRHPPEARMVPSLAPKERHHGFRPD